MFSFGSIAFDRMIEGVSTHVDETQQRIDQMTAKVEKLLNNMGTVCFVRANGFLCPRHVDLFRAVSSTVITRLWAVLHGLVTQRGSCSIVIAHHIDIDLTVSSPSLATVSWFIAILS